MSEKVFKPVSGSSSLQFIRPSELSKQGVKGEILEGVYVEALPNQIDDTKQDFKFEKADGTIVVVNGAGNLPYQMAKVAPGTLVRLNYLGKQEIKTGPRKGKEAHNFIVMTEAE